MATTISAVKFVYNLLNLNTRSKRIFFTMVKVYEYALLQKFQSKVFIVYRTENEEISYTFNIVLKEVTDVLQQFSHYNISPNTGIALRVQDHSPYSIVLILSILNNNCYFIPLQFTKIFPNFEGVLNAHGAKYVITDVKYDDNRKCKEIGLLTILDKKMYLLENLGVDNKLYDESYDLCYSISTSGTTGHPKIVQVPYSCVEPNILALCTRLKLSEKDVIYLCSPFTFDPFVVDFFLALKTGATLLICPAILRLNPKKLLNILWPESQNQPGLKGTTILQTTPSFFRLFGEAVIREVILNENNSLRCLILGGEDFPSRREWNFWLPNVSAKKRIFNIYGITEISCWSSIHECNFNEQWERVPIGSALDDDTILRITDSNGKELFGSCEGELKIGSATRKCYISSTDGRNKNEGMFFRSTGDLVFRDEFGRVFYLGRTDSIVKRMGVRLNLETLQQRIQNILNINSSNVKCFWHEETRRVVCFLQAIPNINAMELMHIRQRLIKNLMEIERPDDIKFVSSFPLNSHGKIDRHFLYKKIASKTNTISKDPLEIFHKFITETLGLDLISNDLTRPSKPSMENQLELSMSFTAAGGTSFQALTLANQIGAILEQQFVQSELLEMLLSSQHSLESVKNFLASCSASKAQVISKTLSVNSNCKVKKRFNFLWSTSLNKCVDSAPSIVGSKWVCVGSHSHILTTLDTRLGAPIAVLELPDRIECKVEIVSTTNNTYIAVVGCYDQHLYAFNFTNGHIYWRVDLGGLIKAKPLVCITGVVVATYSEQFNVVCISLKTKNFIWRRKIGTKGIFANPITINSCEVIVCTLDGSYCRILLNSGELVWLRKCESPIFSSPVVISEDNVIIVAEVAGKVHICNAENGELMKTFCAGSLIFSALTILDDIGNKRKVLFGSYDKHVYCLRYQNFAEKGQQATYNLDLLWNNQLESNIFASPLVILLQDGVYVLCCSTSGLIVLLHIETGEMMAKYKLNAEIFSTPCNLENQIFIGCRDNFLYSFRVH